MTEAEQALTRAQIHAAEQRMLRAVADEMDFVAYMMAMAARPGTHAEDRLPHTVDLDLPSTGLIHLLSGWADSLHDVAGWSDDAGDHEPNPPEAEA